MKRTILAVDLAGTASAARSCAASGVMSSPANTLKRAGFGVTRNGAPARRHRSRTT